ncbi:MAG: hypothetical protein OEL78_07380 [Hyphomicrobiales bacterium]|nr:hypothetical protein [Hyphomicrobiales bacterium]
MDIAAGNGLSGAEAMVEMAKVHGVKHIFRLCGETTPPSYDALNRLDTVRARTTTQSDG